MQAKTRTTEPFETLQRRLALELREQEGLISRIPLLPEDTEARRQTFRALAQQQHVGNLSPAYVDALARTLAWKSDDELRNWIERKTALINPAEQGAAARQLQRLTADARPLEEGLLEMVVDPDLTIADKGVAYCLGVSGQIQNFEVQRSLSEVINVLTKLDPELGFGNVERLGNALLETINDSRDPLLSLAQGMLAIADELHAQDRSSGKIAALEIQDAVIKMMEKFGRPRV